MLTGNHLYDITGTLTPRPPFDFGKSLSFLHGFGPTAGEQSLAGASLTKAVRLHGHTVAFEVQNEGTIEDPGLLTGSLLSSS
jgi:DNA-3-methyladenine glycosylase II